jgi:hypothetical protein
MATVFIQISLPFSSFLVAVLFTLLALFIVFRLIVRLIEALPG